MKEKIIEKANDMFLNLGFKSVTMDDLASEMGISKKTIYAHFQNKTKLVEATTDHLFCNVSDGIDAILEENKEPIEELYAIKAFVMHHLKGEKTSPQYQLQKYYPKIHSSLKIRQFDTMQECVIENLERGIKTGVFRENIDTETISRLYFMGMTGIKDQEMFPIQRFPISKLMTDYLEYHVRGIATEKGLKILDNLLKQP
ncbi:TetR/AcrR family transcriptional regulator [Aquimarina sp. MMG015]|uniref:TetR/AcrR family transcriptional regulator n=1 Tax=unclassified Aquimarina TaxID=2627091 RepID=UPI000E50C03C|nr:MULTISPECIES: TetR/AcrR family transcriptional regulator [unclassified Aquimarina]AXT57704.1 TetR/AcrR family transcriptional regulator [Aquimarina sp. AD1]MBQ4805498.1 TetR/AcrR family transcriptional regulator [Aquimarina sp. MMG015]RKN37043.1 TetR family transcriptional regulator [Aquimarina sp. AD1]